MSRSVIWSFTINNYSEETIGHLLGLDPTIWNVVFGKETAPSTGTPHLQGCIWRFDDVRAKRRTVEIALGGHAWCEPSHNIFSCVGYSVKDGNWFTNYLSPEKLEKMRRVVSTARKMGDEKDYEWLGLVVLNEDDEDQLKPAYNMHKWNKRE